jgi:hypothetical protein
VVPTAVRPAVVRDTAYDTRAATPVRGASAMASGAYKNAGASTIAADKVKPRAVMRRTWARIIA